MARKPRFNASIAVFLILLSGISCIEDITLQRCTTDDSCPDPMICRAGRCFEWVPPWVIPPCSSPATRGRCCDLEAAVIPSDDPECRPSLVTGVDAVSPPARTPIGEIVVTTREGTEVVVLALAPDGTERWRAELEGPTVGGPPPTVRVAADGLVYVDRSAGLWTRTPDGVISTLPAGGTIDGGFAVCAGGIAVALVRGPGGRGPVRLDQTPEAWTLDGSLDVAPALPPAISPADNAICTAWADGTVTVHDLETGALRDRWPDAPSDEHITGLAMDGDGHFWVSTAGGTLERLSAVGDITQYLRWELDSPIHTPPVLTGEGVAMIALGDGRVILCKALRAPDTETLQTLVTTAPGALSLLEGDGFQLLGSCPDGRCLSIFFSDAASYFGASFEFMGEHRHSGLPADAAVSLPGAEGLAALVGDGRLEALVVAGSARNVPWPGPDGGRGNGRCAEGAK